MTTFVTVDPATGLTVGQYSDTDGAALEAMLVDAGRAQESWGRMAAADRTEPLNRMAGLLRAEANDLAALMAREMGKPLAQGLAEVEKCAWACEHYAETGPRALEDVAVPTDADLSFVAYRPLGTILAVMPWNFPLWQVVRFAAPTLLAGNAVLLKPAPTVAGCAQAVERLFRASGLPEGLFRTALVPVERIGRLIADPRIAGVTLTGSSRAGRIVARTAAQHLKKVVLELGGSDPYIVLHDADVALAAETCVTSRLINTGQSCIAAKRFIVVDAVRDEFTEACCEAIRSRRTGPPTEPDTQLGPLARSDLKASLARQMAASVALGARVIAQGIAPADGGWYFPPTLLADVRPGMPAFIEETFGPLGAIVPAADEDEALRLADMTAYGLGAAVFTRDVERGVALATTRLKAGSCFVNDFVKSDPRLPFGGIKASGMGRELGLPGIREFTNMKTVVVRRPEAASD